MKRLAIAALAACLGAATAAASVPDVPSPGARKLPAKPGFLHKRSPAKPKATGPSSAVRAQVEALMERGGRAFDLRDWPGAIDAYTQAIALDPKNAGAHYNLGMANFMGVVDWAKAEAEVRVALRYEPNNTYYQRSLRDVIDRRAQDERDRAYGQQYAAQVEAINKQGVAKYGAGMFSEAEQLFSRALQMQPANAQIRANLEAARQQIALAEQRRQQIALQQQQYEQRQRQYAYEEAQRAKRNEFYNTVTQGLALGQQLAEANRPPPRPAPAPAYSSAPRQYATTTPQPRAPVASAPAEDFVANHAPAPGSCITLEKNVGGSFWSVVNNCPAAVIGDVCFVNDKNFNCGTQIAAGFGPIRAGSRVSIYGPSLQATAWRAKACYYDDWLKSNGCKFK